MKTKTAKDLFQAERLAWIEDCRAAARRLLREQLGREVTIEDVVEQCPRPTYIHVNTAGQVFRCDDFVACGWVKARKPTSNSRYIMKWRLSDDAVLSTRQVRRARKTVQ